MAALRSWTPEMLAWLDARYGTTDIHELTRELNAKFGCDKSETALYVKANQRGLHRPKDSERRKRASAALVSIVAIRQTLGMGYASCTTG